jgi:hypothetical protein
MQSERLKTSYHPYLLVAFHLNCLPEDILAVIPRSTRFDWHHREIHNSFGYDWFKENEQQFKTLKLVAQNKRLLTFNKALLRVIALKRFIENNSDAIRTGRSFVKRVAFDWVQKIANHLGVKKALRFLNLNHQYYSKLKSKAKCVSSQLNICRIKHPSQLLANEIVSIKKYCLHPDYQFWPISSVYHRMVNDRGGHMSLGTFYKYVSLLNLKQSRVFSRRKNHETGIRADAPFKILHADMTEFKCDDHQKGYIYLIQDNFSRAILGHKVSIERRAIHTLENIRQVTEEYLLHSKISETMFLTDDGSENYGEAKQWILQNVNPKINHVVAQVDIHFSNSMIEAANKQIKYRFLYNQKIASYDQLLVYLPLAIQDFNNRPHHVLGGLSPLEVLKGKQLNAELEKSLIQKARQSRVAENQKLKCCS